MADDVAELVARLQTIDAGRNPVQANAAMRDAADALERLVRERDALWSRLNPAIEYVEGTPVGYGEDEIDRLHVRIAELEKDAAYYKWRLTEIMPLFQDARDALPAISLTAAKLHGLDLSLADRMDMAGTRTREDFDAAMREGKG